MRTRTLHLTMHLTMRLAIAMLAAGFTAGIEAGRAQEAPGVTQRIRESAAAMAAGNFPEAARLARSAVELDPAHPPAWRQHGLALLRGGQAEEAVAALSRAVAMDETDATAWRGLALAQWAAEKQNEAVRSHSAFLRLKPEDVGVWRDQATWLIRLERTDQAVAALNRVVELKPDDASARRDLAVLYQRAGRLEEAATAYGKALELRPGDAAMQRDLGWVLWTLGRRDEAVERLANAAKGNVDARERVVFQVVARLSEEGAATEALAYLKSVNPDQPPSEMGLELARTGRLKASEPILANAWESGEKSPDVGLYLAYARAMNAQFFNVGELLEPLFSADSAISPERADLALEVLRLGGTRPEIPALVARLEPVLDQQERQVQRVTDILETAAEARRVREDPEQALQIYRRVLERDPNRASWVWAVLLAERVEGATPYAWLDDLEERTTLPERKSGIAGLRAARRGQTGASIEALQKSIALDPKQPLLRQLLFRELLAEGRTDEARREADWFADQVEGGESTLRSFLAEILTRLGDLDEALDHWTMLHYAFPEQPYYGIETAYVLYRLDRPDEAIDLLQTLADSRPDFRVYELLAEIATARGQPETAVLWAEKGLAAAPSQGLLRYHAEALEKMNTNAPAALASAQAFLEKDPGYVPLTLLAGRMLELTGDTEALEQHHRALLKRNPAFLPSLAALRDHLTRRNRIGDAVKFARRRAELQPDNVEANRQYANSLAQNDRFRQALRILRPLADLPLERALPVLVYSSIAVPSFAGRNSVPQIERHIQSLATNGVAFVNSFQFDNDASATRRVMLLLDDPSPAVVEALDPVLQRHDARVVYIGNAAAPGLSLAGQPLPRSTQDILSTDRWRLASGGPADARRRPVNADGVLGNPLTHPVVVDGAPETAEAFAGRIDRELAASAAALSDQEERILVYPAGDFGQRSLDTSLKNLAIVRESVAKHFTHAVYFDDSGFHLLRDESDPLRIAARAVPSEWGAEELATYLGSGHPLTRSRLELGRVLYWHGQHEEADRAFASAAAAGADARDLEFNRGLNADRQGDIPSATRRLEEALLLDPDSERIPLALERAEERRRPQVDAFLQGWEDNEDRSYYRLGLDGDAFLADRWSIGAAADRNRWKTDGLGHEYGTRLGLRTQWYPAEQIWLSGQLWRLDLDNLDDRWGGEAALRLPNPLQSGYLTLMATRTEIETVEALRADIEARIYALRSYTRLFDVLDLFADLSHNDRTDDNATTMLEGRLLYRVKEWPYIGVGWRFRFADSDVDPPEYWAPEELEQHQLHLNLRGAYGRLSGTLSGDFGYAREKDTDWRFVWGTRAEAVWSLTENLGVSGQLGWFEGPSYERLYGRAGLTGRF